MAMVKRVRQQGYVIGSCSDRPMSARRAMASARTSRVSAPDGTLQPTRARGYPTLNVHPNFPTRLPRVRPFIQALERRGWVVWWDRTILPGETDDQVIEKALEATRCVLVVWSQASIASTWVRAEADEGRQRGILVPVMIDAGVRLPLAFRQIQAANLVGWRGEEAHPEFAKVVQALTGLLGAAPGQLVLEPEVAAQADLQVEPPGIADVESTPQPLSAPPPIQRELYTEPLPRTVSGKKSVVWGIVAVLLLALPILYKVIRSPAENPLPVPAAVGATSPGPVGRRFAAPPPLAAAHSQKGVRATPWWD